MTKLGQALAQDRFGHELRQHQRDVVGLARRRLADLLEGRVLEAAIGPMHTLRRVRPAGGDQPVDHAEILEHFEAARLDALAARAVERLGRGVDQRERDTAAGELDRQGQPGRPCAADQNVSRELFRQTHLPSFP